MKDAASSIPTEMGSLVGVRLEECVGNPLRLCRSLLPLEANSFGRFSRSKPREQDIRQRTPCYA